MTDAPPTLEWIGDASGYLALLDQTALPRCIRRVDCEDVATLAHAIKGLVVRGAPAIGCAAAYGAVLALRGDFAAGIDELAATRPTAVNLSWALERMSARHATLVAAGADGPGLGTGLLEEARHIHSEDAALCAAIGAHGAGMLADGMRVLTHCNTGRLATGGTGTALGVITTAVRSGKRLSVAVGETRPLLQGARLTCFELAEAGIPCTLIGDSAGPGLILAGRIDAVVVGADRIARNGDTANKVGTLPLALAAQRAGVAFYVVAPTTSIDWTIATGEAIVIEERPGSEILDHLAPRLVPAGVPALNPAFDVTPADLITAFVTECGVASSTDAIDVKGVTSKRR